MNYTLQQQLPPTATNKQNNGYKRLRLFLWKIAHGAIPVGAALARRGIKVNPICTMCCDAEEDVQHLIFLCPFSRACWLGSPLAINSHALAIGEREAMVYMRSQMSDDQWGMFTNIIWAIWRTRNDCAYSSKSPCVDNFNRDLSAIRAESMLAGLLGKEGERVDRQTGEIEELCCFTDGSWGTEWEGGAGLILMKGEVLQGYQYWGVPACCAVQAEAIAMLKAIDFVKATKQARCTFLIDCSVVAKIASQLQRPQEEDWRASRELHEIWRAFKQNSRFSCQHIPRDQNDLADILAKKGRIHGGHFTGYTFPL
ncbi:uncharacterized protein LOC144545526 [Carex rostrata]